MPSGTAIVPAGSVSLVVPGTFPSSYQAIVTTGWNANGAFIEPASKLSTQFTVTFPVGPFPNPSSLDWTVTPAGATPSVGGITLSDYLDELRDVLHDVTDTYWSAAKKTK